MQLLMQSGRHIQKFVRMVLAFLQGGDIEGEGKGTGMEYQCPPNEMHDLMFALHAQEIRGCHFTVTRAL